MASERHKLFVQTILALSQAQHGLNDRFFNRRLGEEISNLLEAHIGYCRSLDDPDMRAQARRAYIQSFKKAETLLEEVSYLNKGKAVPVAIARERILFCLEQVLQDAKASRLNRPVASPVLPALPPKPARSEEMKTNSTREKILDFVRSGPGRRPKDVIDRFSALSERTVKRNLKELSEEGLIVKKSENRATYYFASK